MYEILGMYFVKYMVFEMYRKYEFFYSLIKMVYSFVKKNRKKLIWLMFQYCIKRNFGGFEYFGGKDFLVVFFQNLKIVEKILKVIIMCFFLNEID